MFALSYSARTGAFPCGAAVLNRVPNGLSTVDSCLVCDANATNDCPRDCEGVWGGPSFFDSCLVCNGDNACKICPAGTEKCAARVRCTGGCRNCAPNSVSPSGSLCTACGDGKEPSQAQDSCAPCAQGKAGVGGVCATCAAGSEPNSALTACTSCPHGEYKGESRTANNYFTALVVVSHPKAGTFILSDASMLECEFCVAGAEPTFDRTLCQSCALGHYSSANETAGERGTAFPRTFAAVRPKTHAFACGAAGLCVACSAGTQPTNALFEAVRAGGSVCTACTVGQFSTVEDSIGAAYECIKCVDVVSSGMTTRGPGSANVSDCVCLCDPTFH